MVGDSGVLYHLHSLTVSFDLMSDIYIQCSSVCLVLSRRHTNFTGKELSSQYDAVMWNESCSWMGMCSTCTVVWQRGISSGVQKCRRELGHNKPKVPVTYMEQTHETNKQMSHADVLVCDGDQQQEERPSFSKNGMLKLCISASNVLIDLRSSISWGQK